jgi:hypothetical protein
MVPVLLSYEPVALHFVIGFSLFEISLENE